MKNYFLLALTALSLLSAGLPGQSDYRISKGYEVTIHGTMSIHDWVETIGTVTGDIVAGRHTDGGVDLSSIRISMTVRSIKSDMGTVMDNRTYKALKADADPEIIFQVDAPALIMPMRGKEASVSLQGHLTLAGMTRVVALRITYLDISQDSMRFEGEQTINMTDFGVKPPSALFGTLRAGPDITIYFKTVFTIQQK